MLATKLTKEDSMTPYKRLLLEARTLRGRSGAKAFDRATILCAVFDDGEFRQACGNLDDFQAAEVLDEYVDDLCLGFLDLRAMLKHYPRRRQWSDGRLGKMLREMLRANEADTPQSRQPRMAVAETRKQLERQLEEARRERARLDQAKRDEIGRLRQRIAELEAENAILKARVAELETPGPLTPNPQPPTPNPQPPCP